MLTMNWSSVARTTPVLTIAKTARGCTAVPPVSRLRHATYYIRVASCNSHAGRTTGLDLRFREGAEESTRGSWNVRADENSRSEGASVGGERACSVARQ